MVVSTTLTAKSATTHSTTVSLTAVPSLWSRPHGQPAVAADQPGDQSEIAALMVAMTTSGNPVIVVRVARYAPPETFCR